MSSKINSPGNSPGSSLGTLAASLGSALKGVADKAASSSTSSPITASAPVDKVSLTGNAVRLQQLDKAAGTAPDIDTRKVATIKSAIASGNYRVNSQAVAGKLARIDWELGTA